METDAVARRITDVLEGTLRRLASIASGLAAVAAVIGAATFATGLWIFDGSGRAAWVVIGGALCAVPVVAALMAWFLVRRTARSASLMVANVHQFLDTSPRSARALIDHDTGRPIASYPATFHGVRGELELRRAELPALYAGIRAIVSAPGLAAVAVLGMLVVGALGTILLIGGLID